MQPRDSGGVRNRRYVEPKPKPTGVFAQPVRAPDFGQAEAKKRTQRAGNALPPDPRIPEFPDMHFTPKQRKVVRERTTAAVRKIAQQRGENPAETARRLYDEGGPEARKSFHLAARAFHEDQASQFRRLTGHTTGSIEGDSHALTALRTTPEARPGPYRTGLAGAADDATYSTLAFLKAPDRNLFVAAAPGFKKLAAPVVHDAISLPRNAVVSAYVTGDALQAAARGNPGKLKQLGQTIKDTDPLALAVQGRWDEALQGFADHPLNTALEVAGTRGLLRGAGRAARVSTSREGAVLPGTALEHGREFSPNPLTKPVQVANDARKTRNAEKLRAEADRLDSEGDPAAADAKRAEAAAADPRIMSQRHVEHRADVRESMGQPERRRGRTNVMAEMKPTYIHPKEGGHLQRLNVEGAVPIRRVDEQGNFDLHGRVSVEHMRQDIATKLKRLKAEHDAIGPGGKPAMPRRLRRLNVRTQRHLEELAGKSDAQLLNVAHKALDVSAVTNRIEGDVIARGMLYPAEARIARLKTYAFEHMGAKVGKADGEGAQRLLDRHGRALAPTQIESHMRANGVDPGSVAFVTQRPAGTVGAYNVRWSSAKGPSTGTRTGAATIKGLVDTHPRNLTANAVRLQQLYAANVNWERGLSEVAQRAQGKVTPYETKAGATQAAGGIEARTGMKWRPVRMTPWNGRESQLQHLLDHADSEGYVQGGRSHPISQAIEDAVKENATGDGPWALVPDAWARRIEEHSQVYRSVHPAMRAVNTLFRQTVLPLSLSWLTGNAAEAALRTVVQSPRVAHNFSTYRRTLEALKSIDPEEAAHLKDLLGTGHYGSMEQSNVYTSAAQFSNSRFRPIADAMHKLRAAPGPGTLASAYRAYTHFVFNHVNDFIERPFREAMAGHHIRMKLLDSSRAVRNSEQAINEGARGLKNTNAQVALADDVRRAYGQYEAWSPGVRKAALLYTPFVPWAINAVRFLTSVLPKDHPILTAAVAAADTWTEDFRKQHGLDEWTPGHVPAFLLGSVPTPGGGHVRVARFTPFGFAGDPTGTVASQVLPQFSGVLDAFQGRDWKGNDLKNSDGSPFTTDQKVSYAAGQFAEAIVPGLGLLHRAVQAPGSNPLSKLTYVQNPFRTVKGQNAAAPAGKTTSGEPDWSQVKIPSSGGSVDWSKVKIP